MQDQKSYTASPLRQEVSLRHSTELDDGLCLLHLTSFFSPESHDEILLRSSLAAINNCNLNLHTGHNTHHKMT